jgi:hypothetical protein
MNIEKEYKKRCNRNSDIVLHLPKLKEYAEKVKHITEFGVRRGNSTIALLAGNPKRMISYDIKPKIKEEVFNSLNKTNFKLIRKNVLDIEIEETDLLFIDTYHTYKQLKNELDLHSSKVRKYIILHDTETFGKTGEDGGEGLNKALDEFLIENKEWEIIYHNKNNNGLTVLKNEA